MIASGRVEASSKDVVGGMGNVVAAGATEYSAYAPYCVAVAHLRYVHISVRCDDNIPLDPALPSL